MINDHTIHMAATDLYRAIYGDTDDDLLYVSRSSPTEPVHYVWRSGVKLGLAASVAHLTSLLANRATP
jgi:hypothetical protein